MHPSSGRTGDAPSRSEGSLRVDQLVQAKSFWSANQPGFRFASAPLGTREFFFEVEEHRYRAEPHIPEVVGFEHWTGCDVLEVGCGIGTDGMRFARAGARYTGLDESPVALDLARRRFALEQCEGSFVQGSAARLPLEDRRFDLVFSHGVIHHMAEPELAVAELYRVLKPRGEAIVMVYHRYSLNYLFNIMVVRRGLAGMLVLPGVTSVAARLTGEPPEVLEGHRALLRAYGWRYLLDRQLFLSNNTDGPGNPLSRVFSRNEACELFQDFVGVGTQVRFLNVRMYPGGARFSSTALGRHLERRVGWHLYLKGRRPG